MHNGIHMLCCSTVSTSVDYVLWMTTTCQDMFTGSKKGMTLMRTGDGSRVGTGKRMETLSCSIQFYCESHTALKTSLLLTKQKTQECTNYYYF